MTTKYTSEHEWISVEGDVGTVGVTDFAQHQLGDIVFVELPEAGKPLNKGEQAAVIESVKAASEVYAPVGGEVIEVNQPLEDEPGKVNDDAIGEGWFFKLKIADAQELDGLMDDGAYKDYVKGLE